MDEPAHRSRRAACQRREALICLALILQAFSFCHSLGAQEPSQNHLPGDSPTSVVIPDGTPVNIRFAQAIWGFPISPFISDPPRPPFHKGDKVRIVAAVDVALDGRILIRRGSLGQATVTSTNFIIDRKHPTTGIGLRVDWIKSISDQEVALRPGEKGKAHSILLQVLSDHGGFMVDQTSLARGLLGALTFQNMVKSIHQKLWVPVGTRMTAYVHGDIALDPSRLAEAQARLPLPNTTGLITIYRTKGQKDQKADIHCDGKKLVQLGSRQFFQLEVTPGDHAFSVNQGDPIQLPVSAGREYYLYLRWHAVAGTWKLETVSTPEGEDGIADGEMVPPG